MYITFPLNLVRTVCHFHDLRSYDDSVVIIAWVRVTTIYSAATLGYDGVVKSHDTTPHHSIYVHIEIY